ncbi:MAG: MotA/TolQ/ExbB proton channel family protein [Candidatus Firestonebacteria bacterium]
MPESLSLFQSLFKNVWALFTVLVLILLSFISVYYIVERYLRYKAAKIDVNAFINKLRRTLRKEGRFDKTAIPQALDVCREAPSPVASVVRAALARFPATKEDTEEAMKKTALEEISKLEQNVVVIGTIGSVSPFIGLLGTVIGVTEAFMKLSDQGGAGGVGVVGPGIAQALIATIAGLFVAIPSVAAYNYFVKKIDDFTTDITISSLEVVNLLTAKDVERSKWEEMLKELRG